eukprot:gene3391-6733_t
MSTGEILESDIRRKLQSTFDVNNLYSIFDSLVATVAAQQDQIRVLTTKLSKIDQVGDGLRHLQDKVQKLEYSLGDGTHEIPSLDGQHGGRNENSEPVTPDSVTEINASSTAAVYAILSTDPISITDQIIVDDTTNMNSKLLNNAKKEILRARSKRSLMSPETEVHAIVSKTDWRSKRHRLLLALQVKGREIKKAREAAAKSSKDRRLNPQRTINHRIRTLESRMLSLQEKLDATNLRIEQMQFEMNQAVPSDLRDQLAELRAFSESMGQVMLQNAQEKEMRAIREQEEAKEKGGKGGTSLKANNRHNSPVNMMANRMHETEDMFVRLIREQVDHWAREHRLGPHSAEAQGQSIIYARSKPTSILQQQQQSSASPFSSNAYDESDDGERQQRQQLEMMMMDDIRALKEKISEVERNYVTRIELMSMLVFDEHSKSINSPLADKFRSMLEKDVRMLVAHKADKDDLNKLSSEIRVESSQMSDAVDNTVREAMVKLEKEANEKATKFETKLRNLTKMMKEVETNARSHGSHEDSDGLRPEFQKIAERIAKTEEEHKIIANKFAEDLETIQDEMGTRPSEAQVARMVTTVEESLRRQLGETNEDLSATVTKIVGAVRNKASKDEVLRIVMERLAAAEATHKVVEDEDPAPAGSVKCISCGANRQFSPPRHHVSPELPPEMIPATRADYEQLLDVINRSAGLKSLSRQYNPMQPKQHPYTRKQKSSNPEPLYKRAQLASHMKEMVKTSAMPQSSANILGSKSLTAPLYYIDDTAPPPARMSETSNKSGGIGHNSSSNNSIRLPGVVSNVRPIDFNDDIFSPPKSLNRINSIRAKRTE